jgi:lauroyl/myristoyl acyltransferase
MKFAHRYRHYVKLAEAVARFVPDALKLPSARLLGRFWSPYHLFGPAARRAMVAALGMDERQARAAFDAVCANHGLAAVTVYAFEGPAAGWLAKLVRVAEPDRLADIARDGGLVMTYHSFHQNLLAAYLGRHCGDLHALAAPVRSSALYPHIGTFLERLNQDSEGWFGTGHYLYTEPPFAAARATHELLSAKRTVLTLCDTHLPQGPRASHGMLFGRTFTPPQGAVALAARLGVPIHAALLVPDERGLTLRLQRLSTNGDVPAILADYCAFFESWLRRNPACWQDWMWHTPLETRP